MSSTKRWLRPASAFLWVGMLSWPTSVPYPWAEPSLMQPPPTALRTPGAPTDSPSDPREPHR